MLTSILTSVIIILGFGILAKIIADNTYTYYSVKSITKNEAIIAIFLSLAIGIPVSIKSVYNWARSSESTYIEFINGREVKAVEVPIMCTRDGPCRWEYSCDPYTICTTTCNGKSCSTSCTTHYHDCPYLKREYNHIVQTTIGDYTIDENRFPTNWNDPDLRWRSRRDVPQRVALNAGVGPVQFWIDADKRIREGNPWAVTKYNKYTNYLLGARQSTIMQQELNSYVDRYKESLPDFDNEIYNFYQSDKVYGIGPWNLKDWNDTVSKFNASFGFLQGDLHLVLVDDNKHKVQPDEYIIALKTYWQRQELDVNSLAKNTVVVALGVSNDTIRWARATTGMPVGNESMIIAVRDELVNVPFTKEYLFGNINLLAATPDYGSGVLSQIISKNQTSKFERVSMLDFEYLFDEIPVPFGWRILAGLFAGLISIPFWGFMIWYGDEEHKTTFKNYWRR